ncbi:putative endo-N-acetylneuraminidase [Klebsiella pneumoniae]|nr:putative endo-N-acetylneuraminidase [Klebsiella pneumoniae]
MTVSTEVDHNDYTGNGVTTSFPYTFRIFKKSDLTVQVADLNENITVLTLDTDYSVTGAGTYSGGNVVLMSPLANGWQISISRDLPVTQETDLRNQGKFFAEVHEDAFDKLTMLIQQCFSFLRLALRKPSFIANYYDALNNRIRNLRDPSQKQDAATKNYVDEISESDREYINKLVTDEAEARVEKDNDLQGQINAEVSERIHGDVITLEQAKAYTRSEIVEANPSDSFIGMWAESASQLKLLTISYGAVRVRGFYNADDGGDGTWLFTGNTIPAKASTHDISNGMIYDAAGNEYSIDISSGRISALSNGAKTYTYAQAVDQSTDDFVCLGQAVNGILSKLTLAVTTTNNEVGYDGGSRLSLIVPTGRYRIGKEPIKGYSGVNYHFEDSRVFVYAGKSYTYAVTGKRLDGFRHGYEEIKEKWEAVNEQVYWGSVLQDVNIYGGVFIGDHAINKTSNACSSGVAFLILNPEGVTMHRTYVKSSFHWAHVAMPAMIEPTIWNQQGHRFDNNDLDYRYIMDFWVSAGITSRFGNFNRMTYYSCKFESGRRGVFRNGCDWSAAYNTEIINRLAWRNSGNVSGVNMEYVAVLTGTAFHASGCYIGPAAAKDYNAEFGSVYGTAQNHIFTGCYTEWTYNFYTVSAWGFNGKASRLQGLKLDCVSVYKDNFTEYSQIRFETKCFGTIDDGGNYTYPDGFTHYDTPNGQTPYAIGSPVRDSGAFRHGGFDFKYGPYNTYLTSGTDWDSWRDRPYAKEMFNPYGLQINSGTVFLPWQQPSVKSMVCIWLKDLTGNFDPRNIVAWQTAASQDGSGNTDEALYKSFAEKVVDFGNGYKMLMLAQKRLSAWDGQYTFARNANIVFTVPAETPIVIKAVEAFTGGIPLFPNGCGNYIPESNGTSITSQVSNQVGLDSSLGGGLFFNGDIIGPWVHMRRTQSGYRITPSLTSGYTLDRKMVTGGYSLEAPLKVAFSATIVTVNSNATTIISVPTAYLPYIAVGIPIYITGGSSASITGQIHLVKRLLNSDGTASSNYLVQGTIGAVGDILTIDQSQITPYTFFNDRSFNAVTANSVTVNGVSVATAHRSSVSSGIGYGGASGAKALEFYVNGGTAYSQRIVATSTTVMSLETGGNLSVNGNTYPNADGTYSLGTPSGRWSQVFASNSVIGTSDETHKTRPRADTPAETDAYYEIGQLPGVWQWLEKYMVEGDNARLHSGPTVQAAISVMDKYGLDWREYSAFCYDEWDAQDAIIETWDDEWEVIPGTPAELDEAGNVLVEAVPETRTLIRAAGSNVIQEAREAGSVYAFRKEELLFWISRAIIAKQRDITERLEKIESSI